MKQSNRRIYLKQWQALKPVQGSTDPYYVKLCNKVKQAMLSSAYATYLAEHLDEDSVDELCCFLVSYLEDLVSGTNFWNTFVRLHQEQYGKPLPFYATEEYYEEEINIQDVSFLIWYYINCSQQEVFLSFESRFIFFIAHEVMEVFDEVWETAPENDDLKAYFQISASETDYFTVQDLMNRLFFDAYLFHPDTTRRLTDLLDPVVQRYADEEDPTIFVQDAIDYFLFSFRSRLLALNCREWAAAVWSDKYPLSEDITRMSTRITSRYFYKGQDAGHVFVEHIATGIPFKLTQENFGDTDGLDREDEILLMSLIQWKDEWWSAGMYTVYEHDSDTVTRERNSTDSRRAIASLGDQKLIQGQLARRHEKFVAFNEGTPILFMKLGEMRSYFDGFLALPDEGKPTGSEEQVPDRVESVVGERLRVLQNPDLDEEAIGLLFFNPQSGPELVIGVNEVFPLDHNPFYLAEHEEVEQKVNRILQHPEISTELAQYFVGQAGAKLPFFAAGIGKTYLTDFDFMLRFWKYDEYDTGLKVG